MKKFDRIFKSKELSQYKAAIKNNNQQEAEKILIEARDVYWCICGVTCQKKKNNHLHKETGCEYSEPSILPYLAMSIDLKHKNSIQWIKDGMIHYSKFKLSALEYASLLKDVLFKDTFAIIELFDLDWFLSFKLLPKTAKELYAKYVYGVFSKMVNDGEAVDGGLNSTYITRAIPILLPRGDYNNYEKYSKLITQINQEDFGALMLSKEDFAHHREEMVKQYGMLWKMPKNVSKIPRFSTIFQSLIRYVLFEHVGKYTEEESRWLASLTVYRQYIEDQVAILVNTVMSDSFAYKDLHHIRYAIDRYIPAKNAKYTASDKLIVGWLKWCSCCSILFPDEAKAPLLSADDQLVF